MGECAAAPGRCDCSAPSVAFSLRPAAKARRAALAQTAAPAVDSLPYRQDAAGADGGPNKRFAAFKFNSVGSQFKRQLGELMAQLGRMEPHYIRCIKPNSANQPAL